jgi:hypothetical protein
MKNISRYSVTFLITHSLFVLLGLCAYLVYIPSQASEVEPLKMVFDPKIRKDGKDAFDQEYDAAESLSRKKKHPRNCPYSISEINDLRANKETLGSTLKGEPLISGDVKKWIYDGLKNLSSYGYKESASEKSTSAKTNLVINASLYKAYTWHAYTTIHSMIVLQVEYLLANGESKKFKIRGYGGKVNWVGKQTEYMDTLNFGLRDALDKIVADMDKLCI